MTAIPAITIWQPWASLIAAAAKPYEFRKWAAPRSMRGRRIAIHAGARAVKRGELQELIYKLQSPFWRETGLVREIALPLVEQFIQAPKSLPLSSVLCTAVLGQPIKGAELAAQLGIDYLNDSERDEHSNWGWPLSDIEVLQPFVPAGGAQGFWTWKEERA
jgi:hypothetical protein